MRDLLIEHDGERYPSCVVRPLRHFIRHGGPERALDGVTGRPWRASGHTTSYTGVFAGFPGHHRCASFFFQANSPRHPCMEPPSFALAGLGSGYPRLLGGRHPPL